MIQINKEYQPINALRMRDGYTSFGVPISHHNGERLIDDGYINVVVKGDFDFHMGDRITIRQITGANIRNNKYFTIMAKIGYKTKAEHLAEPNRELIDANIPDDI